MHTAVCLYCTGAGVNLSRLELVPQELASCVERNNLLNLRTATKHLLVLGGSILLHLRPENLQTQMWYWSSTIPSRKRITWYVLYQTFHKKNICVRTKKHIPVFSPSGHTGLSAVLRRSNN